MTIGPQVNRGFGAFLRDRALGTPEESYLAMVGGDFMIDHANADQFGFAWNEKGVPLTDFEGSMYVADGMYGREPHYDRLGRAPGGAPAPGKDQPGNWYHDHNQPYVDLGGVTPRLHWQIGFDDQKQEIHQTRGLVTLATEGPGAALLEGQVTVQALTEYPTRQDNYAVAIAAQAWPPATPLDKPFTWTRRLLYVKAPTAAGMNYLVVRDDFGGSDERTPNFNCWWFADDVDLSRPRRAIPWAVRRRHGPLRRRAVAGEDSSRIRLSTTSASRSSAAGTRPGTASLSARSRCSAASRARRTKGSWSCCSPTSRTSLGPIIENWQGDKGVKVVWKGETHYVLLDTRDCEIDADAVKARATCLVVKVADERNFTLSLPAGGQASLPRQGYCRCRPGGDRRQRWRDAHLNVC